MVAWVPQCGRHSTTLWYWQYQILVQFWYWFLKNNKLLIFKPQCRKSVTFSVGNPCVTYWYTVLSVGNAGFQQLLFSRRKETMRINFFKNNPRKVWQNHFFVVPLHPQTKGMQWSNKQWCLSSVGRASDWKSVCPRFDSWRYHFLLSLWIPRKSCWLKRDFLFPIIIHFL